MSLNALFVIGRRDLGTNPSRSHMVSLCRMYAPLGPGFARASKTRAFLNGTHPFLAAPFSVGCMWPDDDWCIPRWKWDLCENNSTDGTPTPRLRTSSSRLVFLVVMKTQSVLPRPCRWVVVRACLLAADDFKPALRDEPKGGRWVVLPPRKRNAAAIAFRW